MKPKVKHKKVLVKVEPKKIIRKIIKPVIKKKQEKIIEKQIDETIKEIPIIDKIDSPEIEAPQMTEIETIKPEIVQTQPIVSIPEIQTLNSSSMLDDLMTETDKDSEPVNENENNIENDLLNDVSEDQKETFAENTEQTKTEKLGDKLTETLTTDGEDWQNPSDFRKMCAVNAMMYVEGGAILLSFIGQMISGDWSAEGEKKYTPSEERRKLIRAPLAKKFELNKDHSKTTPTGALITAIVFTIIPIVIVAFKDRKQRVKNETLNIENLKLKNDLVNTNAELERLRSTTTNTANVNIPKPMDKFIIKTRGRHKNDCQCDKCNLKRTKSKRK